MKRILYIIATFCALLSVTSCDEWLEATSTTRIPVNRLLETRGGFCDALSGIYISLGEEQLYGTRTSFGFADMVAYPYNYESNTTNKAIQTHVYTNTSVKKIITNIWMSYYNIIAQANITLEYLEKNRESVFPSEKEYLMFKGELLGLRAYCHFEVMRTFGLGDITGDNASKLTVPFVSEFDKEPVPQKSYSETFELIFKDLEESLTCLETADPLAGKITAEEFASINQDGFWTNRKKHFNYYAALAVKARMYQWAGDLDNASKTAQTVIDKAFDLVKWVDPESLKKEGADYEKDWAFSCEHLFSLEITNLYIFATRLFVSAFSSDDYYLIPTSLVDDILYRRVDPTTGSLAGAEDVRGPAFQLVYNMNAYHCYKLYAAGMGAYRDLFPMVRISEMYYIVAEKLIADGDKEGALKLLDEVRLHRGISDTYDPKLVDASEELMKEYYREFINEGQLIFWLKHKQVTSSISPTFALTAADLVIPYPEDEINYGRVQEK